MASQAQRPAVGRDIEPARRARNDVVTFEAFFPATTHTSPAVPTQDVGPQSPPAPC